MADEKSIDKMTFKELCELLCYIPKNKLLDTDEVALVLDRSEAAVRYYRQTGTGPEYFQPPGSRKVLYSELDVLRWIASGRTKSTTQKIVA